MHLHTIFTDLRIEVIESYDQVDRAATVLRVSGGYVGSSPGWRRAPGSRSRLSRCIFAARAGKIIENRYLMNDAELARQVDTRAMSR